VQIRAELLLPVGFQGMLGGLLRSRDGMLAGCIAVFCRRPEAERLAEIGMQLTQLRAAVEETLRNAIDVAQLAGARLPKISADALSRREREIANLAAKGFSDLNIAERLEISEGTVGRHLHNIYRKLGVSSRLELADVLYVG
jgi:DNA-binding NarL/FixJ family response regulator